MLFLSPRQLLELAFVAEREAKQRRRAWSIPAGLRDAATRRPNPRLVSYGPLGEELYWFPSADE